MSQQLQLRRGSTSQVAAFTGAQGEAVVDTTKNIVVVNDGQKQGGWPMSLANRTAVLDSTYNALATDRLIAFVVLTAARAVNLPAAATYPQGEILTIIDETGNCSTTNTITILPAGADSINVQSSAQLYAPFSSIAVESNGSNAWTIITTATEPPAPTLLTPYLNRLFLSNAEQTPQHTILAFNSHAEAQNYFGVGSPGDILAGQYFTAYAGVQAQMLWARFPEAGGRPRLFGANLITMTLAELQAIAGSLSITFTQGTLSAPSLNLTSASSFANAATLIANALNASLPIVGVYPNSSIAAGSASCTAYCTGCVMVVTGGVSGTIYPGSEVTTLASFSPTAVFISDQLSSAASGGALGGLGVYGLSVSVDYIASETMNLAYGVFTPGTPTLGAPAEGQMLSGAGVAADTTIARPKADQAGAWILPQSQTVGPITISATPGSVNVTLTQITGATENTQRFDFVNSSYWPTDSSSTISYASGSAAGPLGLTQAAGAVLSSPGSASPEPGAFMQSLVATGLLNATTFQTTNDLDYYASSDEQTQESLFSAWAASTGGQYQFLPPFTSTTPPVGTWPAPAPVATVISDAAYTVLYSDRMIVYTALTAARIISLPAAARFPQRTLLAIIDESGACSATNTLTVDAAGSDTINGASSAVLSSPYGYIALESNGSNAWTIVDLSTLSMGQQAANNVAITGGSVVGLTNFSVSPSGQTAEIFLNSPSSSYQAALMFQRAGVNQWQMGQQTGSDDSFFLYNISTSTTDLKIDAATGAVTIGATMSVQGQASFAASTTSAASTNTPLGVAPTAPNNGDEWITTSGAYLRANGMTLGGVASIGQARIPFILPGAGTMGNNGAISGLTALPRTYNASGAYIYLPAGAIASGSAAGWYWFVASSATAGTVYNNNYTSGTPAAPGSPTAFSTTGPGAWTLATATYFTAYTLAIAGNAVGANGSVRLAGNVSYSSSTNAKTFAGAYGAYVFGSSSPSASGNVSSGIYGGFGNCGATNAQSALTSSALATAASAGAPAYGAVDSTASQNLTVQLKLAATTDFIVLEGALVELIPGVP